MEVVVEDMEEMVEMPQLVDLVVEEDLENLLKEAIMLVAEADIMVQEEMVWVAVEDMEMEVVMEELANMAVEVEEYLIGVQVVLAVLDIASFSIM